MSAPVTLQQLTDQLDALEQQATTEISEASDAAALEQLRVGLLGKKGRISGVLGAMGKLPGSERPLVGQRANVLKTQVQSLLAERLAAVKQAAMAERIARESIDVTAPASGIPMGHRHPLITTTEEIALIQSQSVAGPSWLTPDTVPQTQRVAEPGSSLYTPIGEIERATETQTQNTNTVADGNDDGGRVTPPLAASSPKRKGKPESKKSRVKGAYGAGEENFHRIQLLRASTEAEISYKRQKIKESKVRVQEAKLRMLIMKNQLTEKNICPPSSESDSDS